MTKYKITKFVAGNIANVDSVSFETDGNVTVTGRNGAGKSTIKKALMWVLCGSTADGEKLMNGKGGLPFAEVELSDGVTLRKELKQKVTGGKISRSTDCYIGGLPAKEKEVQAYFGQIMPFEIYKAMIDLFGFFALTTAEQRAILLNHFSDVTDAQIVASNKEFAGLNFGGRKAEEYIKAQREQARKYRLQVEMIPARIEELQSIAVDESTLQRKSEIESKLVELNETRQNLDNQLDGLKEQINRYQRANLRIAKLNGERTALEQSKWNLKEKIGEDEKRLDKLREEWRRAEKNTCPTCGQRIDSGKLKVIKESIVEKGRALVNLNKEREEKIVDIEKRLSTLDKKKEEITAEINSMDVAEENNGITSVRNSVQSEINSLERELGGIENQIKLTRASATKAENLRAELKDKSAKMSEHERLAALAEKFILAKTGAVTSAINSNFANIAFKMYETTKGGEVKPVCDATLNGVPYAYLSKGERLKAALDLLNAFQNHYGLMFPLIIDDAESYTSNTLTDVDNQKILMRVVEGEELTLTVEGGRTEAQCG